MFSSVFMEKMVGFVKNYFPVFMLGAVFGKVIELSVLEIHGVGLIGVLGRDRAVLSIIVVCAILTYGGVRCSSWCSRSIRGRDVPAGRHPEAADTLHYRARRLHLHDGRAAGHAADPEHLPRRSSTRRRGPRRSFGLISSAFVFGVGLFYIENRRRAPQKSGEGYGKVLVN
jgi:hypothetical protein